MLVKNAIHQTREVKIVPTVAPVPAVTETAHSDEEGAKAELRRQMYERIARGNALAEAEEHARRMRNGR